MVHRPRSAVTGLIERRRRWWHDPRFATVPVVTPHESNHMSQTNDSLIAGGRGQRLTAAGNLGKA